MDYRKMVLPGNSNSGKKPQEPEKPKREVHKVVKGDIVGNYHEPMRKISQLLFAEDFGTVKKYILDQVLWPAIKNTIADTVTSGINMWILGNRNGTPIKPMSSINSPTKYSTIYRLDGSSPKVGSTANSRFFFENPIVATKDDAEEVIMNLKDYIEAEDSVSVAVLYSMLGLESEATYNNYGWYNVGKAKAIPVKDGWVINLPKPVVLD